jgi:hypothetical protein
MNKNEAFELDTFVVLPEEMKGEGLSVHGLHDWLACALEYHQK